MLFFYKNNIKVCEHKYGLYLKEKIKPMHKREHNLHNINYILEGDCYIQVPEIHSNRFYKVEY